MVQDTQDNFAVDKGKTEYSTNGKGSQQNLRVFFSSVDKNVQSLKG